MFCILCSFLTTMFFHDQSIWGFVHITQLHRSIVKSMVKFRGLYFIFWHNLASLKYFLVLVSASSCLASLCFFFALKLAHSHSSSWPLNAEWLTQIKYLVFFSYLSIKICLICPPILIVLNTIYVQWFILVINLAGSVIN